MATITVPDFKFSGFYYAELLEDLVAWMRVNVPEITDEDPAEPFIQLLRANALMGHLNNVLLDLVAKERFLPTLALRSSLRSHLALIGYILKQATPASLDVLIQLSQTFAAAMTPLFGAGATVATTDTSTTAAILFQTLVDKNTARTDQVYAVYAYDVNLAAYTDHSVAAQGGAGSPFTAGWAGGMAAQDILYIGHPDIMWDTARFTLNTPMAGVTGVWEYYDNMFNTGNPDIVQLNGPNLTFYVNGFIGSATNHVGAVIRVTCNTSGAYEDCTSGFGGGQNYITTTGLLGQGSVSTSIADYTITALWQDMPTVVDGTAALSATGNVSYMLPQSVLRKWQPVAINGLTAYWLRFRASFVSGAPALSVTSINITQGKQYAMVSATQGQTQADSPLASSDGLAAQSYQLAHSPVIDDANLKVYVTESGVESLWTRVTSFISALPADTVYTVDFDDNGVAAITFGDGTNGKIPQAGSGNIRVGYRSMDDANGNVGQNTATVNRSGFPNANMIYNPRAGNGYVVREGSTPEDIARLKIAGPATLRTLGRALTAQDVVSLALAFIASDGSEPFVRALAIEESFGVKTVECVVVGQGGNAASAAQLSALQDYFNGNATSGINGVLVQNNQCTPTNYVKKLVNVVATVYGGSQTALQTALTALLGPTAVLSDGTTYRWAFGGTVPLAVVSAAMMDTSPAPRNVTGLTLNAVAADLALATRELPGTGTITLTMVP